MKLAKKSISSIFLFKQASTRQAYYLFLSLCIAFIDGIQAQEFDMICFRIRLNNYALSVQGNSYTSLRYLAQIAIFLHLQRCSSLNSIYIQQSINNRLIYQQMNIKHIPIPFDELQIFKQQQKYQHYLIETMIYSTKVTLHQNDAKIKMILILTKKNLWLEEDLKSKNRIKIPLSAIQEIIKCQQHPELVLLTSDLHNNLRISTTNEDRCQNIISAISFYFTYLTKNIRLIKVFIIKQNSLYYFERTIKQKKSGPKLNLERYQFFQVKYVQATDCPDIFGKIVIQKMAFDKLINSEGSHLIHIAKVNEQEWYVCHTFDKDEEFIKRIRRHKNQQFIVKMIYCRALQFKVQVFFQALPPFNAYYITMKDFFKQIYDLYDKMKLLQADGFITAQMLSYADEKYEKVILRQFRYKQFLVQYDYQRFLYKRVINEKSQEDKFVNKIYNIGMLLYYFLFGRTCFEHEDISVSIYLKHNLEKIPFPTHTKIIYSKKTRQFIQDCILGNIISPKMLKEHLWVRQQSSKQ